MDKLLFLSGRYLLFCIKIIFLFISIISFSQSVEDEKYGIIEKRIEYLSEELEESNIDYTTVFDQLSYYYNHPLSLNEASLNDLEELGILTGIQINDLLSHIEENGDLLALEELQAIRGFDLMTINLIRPFIKVVKSTKKSKSSLKDVIWNGESQLIFLYQKTLEERMGFSSINSVGLIKNDSSKYFGSDARIYTRYRYRYNDRISFGILGEKDAGEEFFQGTQKQGFDFYSSHVYVKGYGKLKELVIGDFQAQFGQGLTYWSGLALNKSIDITSIKRNSIGLKPYTSIDENLFLRGGGATFKFNKIESTVFYSYNAIDVNVDKKFLNNTATVVTSFVRNGLHRTYDEIQNKDIAIEQQFGGHIAYKERNLNVGFTGVSSLLNVEFNPKLQPYSQFRNLSNKRTNLGLDYSWIFRNVNFFGEYSKSIGEGNAFVSGAITALDPNFSMVVLYRDYDRNFHPLYSAAIGENTINENEKGLYFGCIAQFSNYFTISGYYDQFIFPWLKFGVDAPSRGSQYVIQIAYEQSKKLKMYFRVRERNRLKNKSSNSDHGINPLVNEKHRSYRYNINYEVSRDLKIKSRLELVNYKKEGTSSEVGYLVYQDIIYKPLNKSLSFSLRYGLFNTESFNSRIYAYENDVLYSFNIPAYFNKGIRTYITTKYRFSEHIDIWLRYSITYLNNVDIIGSGLQRINGNTESEIKVQVRFKF